MSALAFILQAWLYGVAVLLWLALDAPYGEQDENGFRLTPWKSLERDWLEAIRSGQ